MSFAARVLLTTVTILAVTVGGLTLAADGWLRESLETSLRQELERETRLLAATLVADGEDLPATARHLGRLIGHRVTFIDSTGRVVGDSDFDDASLDLLDNHLDRPEVRDALARGMGVSRRLSASTRRTEVKVAVRAWPGVVRLSAPVARIEAVVDGVQRAVILAALLAMLVGTGLAVPPVPSPRETRPRIPWAAGPKSASWSGRFVRCRTRSRSASPSSSAAAKRPGP